jgi:hypothetical protein
MPRGRNQGEDLTGRKFGRLTVIGLGNGRWECRCDCGNACFTDSFKLTRGQKKSCGCLIAEGRLARAHDRSEMARLRSDVIQAAAAIPRPLGICSIKGCARPERSVGFCAHHYDIWNRYGHPFADELGGRRKVATRTRHKERSAYSAMKSRCTNPNVDCYAGYGARGITVCDRWMQSFDAFFEDMGPAPPGTSLERLEVNGNYEPTNCKWGTSREQMRNTRATRLTPEMVADLKARYQRGEKVVRMAEQLGVSYGAVYAAVTGRSWTDIEVSGSG